MSISVVITYTCDKCGKKVVTRNDDADLYMDEEICEPDGWQSEYPPSAEIGRILVCDGCKSK